MYYKNKIQRSTLQANDSYEGETLERKLVRMMTNGEPVTGTGEAPLIYQERKDGVQAAYNIRTDRFDIALDATDVLTANRTARREMRIGEKTFDTMTDEQKTKFHQKFPTNKFNTQTGG